MSRKPRIGLLVLSTIRDDPRVRRQGDLLASAGWDVIGFGLPGGRSGDPAWPVVDAGTAVPLVSISQEAGVQPRPSLPRRLARVLMPRPLRQALFTLHAYGGALAKAQAIASGMRGWEADYWAQRPEYAALLDAARAHTRDVWIANDWNMLPVAAQLCAEQGAKLVYDTHEMAAQEYIERRSWRLFDRPLVVAVEKAHIGKAALVSTVSQGIGEALQRLHGLATPPLVIRNMPLYRTMPFRPTGERIEVLYQGVVSEPRGIESLVRSVPLWRDEFRLTIRGPATPDYLARLERLIADLKIEDRVNLALPVPMTGMIEAASACDIGLVPLEGHSPNHDFALPNKLFEYAMAGLCLCASDFSELRRIVTGHGIGVMLPDLTPPALAGAINGLLRDAIDRHKRAALEAAKSLNWETEGARLLAALDALTAGDARAAKSG